MASSRIDLSEALWFKSSHSNGDGGECVEVARAFPGAALWRKSSYSSERGGACVEIAAHPAAVHVRDSKNPGGPALTVAPTTWTAFAAHIGA